MTTTCILCHRLLPKKSMLHIWGGDYICNFRKITAVDHLLRKGTRMQHSGNWSSDQGR